MNFLRGWRLQILGSTYGCISLESKSTGPTPPEKAPVPQSCFGEREVEVSVDHQFVANATHGFDHIALVPEFTPKATHMVVHCACLYV